MRAIRHRAVAMVVALWLLPSGLSGPEREVAVQAQASQPRRSLTIHGDPADPTGIPDELKRVYQHIDANFERHLERLLKWVRIPSVSNTVEGEPHIWESAKFIRDVIINELGCKAEIYAPGLSEWGAPGHPVVYGRCDVGAKKTVIDYSMGDVMPIFRPEVWQMPPFAGAMVERPPYKRVLIGRGASNDKGTDMAEINALVSIKAVTGTLPVNIIFVSEHDEERMDVGLRTFMFKHPELFKDADAAVIHGNTQESDGRGGLSGQSVGCVVFELETSQAPSGNGLEGQPLGRHMKMLTTVFADDSPLVKSIAKEVVPPSQEEVAYLRREAEAKGRNPSFDSLLEARTAVSVSITGSWSGNMAPGYAGNYRPPIATSKIDIRYPPAADGRDVVKKVRAHLDQAGYSDVKMNVIGIVDWAYANAETQIAQAFLKMYRQFGVPYTEPPKGNFFRASTRSYGPNYLFSRGPLKLPMAMGGLGGVGGGAHADNEWVVINGDGKKVYGFAGAMKGFATVLYNYAGKTGPLESNGQK